MLPAILVMSNQLNDHEKDFSNKAARNWAIN